MVFWVNPWDDAVPVPIEELAEAMSGVEGTPGSVTTILVRWRDLGPNLDAYVLPSQPLGNSVGIRYGNDGPDYLSPYVRPDCREKIAALLAKYTEE